MPGCWWRWIGCGAGVELFLGGIQGALVVKAAALSPKKRGVEKGSEKYQILVGKIWDRSVDIFVEKLLWFSLWELNQLPFWCVTSFSPQTFNNISAVEWYSISEIQFSHQKCLFHLCSDFLLFTILYHSSFSQWKLNSETNLLRQIKSSNVLKIILFHLIMFGIWM